VSALRLAEKGYRVLVLEKGRRLGPNDFPKTNWNLKRWLWLPTLGWRGLFKMTFFPHLTVLSGVGVGGGSLVYANTLPVPKEEFFAGGSWGRLADWRTVLAPHYKTAQRMLGATPNPNVTYPDEVLREVAKEIGREEHHHPTTVAVYFGEPGKTVPDPYFGGEGPERTGCIQCGGCMLGCRHGAKNTLDKNYLYFAEKKGARVEPDTEVEWVRPGAGAGPGGGYEVSARQGARLFGRRRLTFRARNVIFAGGVLGTVDLLLRLKASPDGLPRLSERLGDFVRTNSEALIGVVSRRPDVDMSKGIAIGSILHTDEHSHIEPVRYSAGSGFFRSLGMPHVSGATFWVRFARMMGAALRHPLKLLRAWLTWDWAKSTMILLYMRSLDGHIRLRRGRSLTTGFRVGMTTALGEGAAPTASIPEATALAQRVGGKVDGLPMSLVTETMLGIPTTAHILGGCCMGDSPETGVIDKSCRAFGYEGLYVIDGSAISANPGVNPSLTICALAEHAMSAVPPARALEPGREPAREDAGRPAAA
jgi:cholesterol oxidase